MINFCIFFRHKIEEVSRLETQIKQKSDIQRKAGVELDATCQICLTTKFADGIGHLCNYCSVRCCARCGGKVALRSSRVIWVCILCRKKQEILIKSGSWTQQQQQQYAAAGSSGRGSPDSVASIDPIFRRIEEDMLGTTGSTTIGVGGYASLGPSAASTPLAPSGMASRRLPHQHSVTGGSVIGSAAATPSSGPTAAISSMFSRAMSLAGPSASNPINQLLSGFSSAASSAAATPTDRPRSSMSHPNIPSNSCPRPITTASDRGRESCWSPGQNGR